MEQIVELLESESLPTLDEVAKEFIQASVELRDRLQKEKEQQKLSTISILTASSQQLFDSNKEFDSLLASLSAGKEIKQAGFKIPDNVEYQVKVALQNPIIWIKERNRLEGHNGEVNSVSFINDSWLASSSEDGIIKLWDVTTGEVIKENELGVNSVNFSPNGRIASQNADGIIKLWDITTGNEIKTLDQNEIRIYNFIFSLDEQWLASQNADYTFTIWDVTTGNKINTFKRKGYGFIDNVSFSPTNKKLLA